MTIKNWLKKLELRISPNGHKPELEEPPPCEACLKFFEQAALELRGVTVHLPRTEREAAELGYGDFWEAFFELAFGCSRDALYLELLSVEAGDPPYDWELSQMPMVNWFLGHFWDDPKTPPNPRSPYACNYDIVDNRWVDRHDRTEAAIRRMMTPAE